MKPGDPAAVTELFEAIAPRYDQLNDLLSLGLHRLWKRQAVAWLAPRAGQRLVDLCCGTGDLALLLAERGASQATAWRFQSRCSPRLSRSLSW
ncbi:MAG: class I SAM-dependent methyltransferase, partial [Cyanobacteriota bacterium]